jgi:F0F1-type ATP synthase assembly protein I
MGERGLTRGKPMKLIQVAITIAVGSAMIYLGVENMLICGISGGFAAYLATLLFMRLGWYNPEQAETGN